MLKVADSVSSDRWDAFWNLVDASGDCWEWTGTKSRGYGYFYDTRAAPPRRGWLAHRVAYISLVGPLGDQTLDHLCRNRGCVNPDHLRPATSGENVLRGYGLSAKNARKTHCVHGHPFDEANTHVRSRGDRECRTCMRDRARERWRRLNW